MNCYLLTGGRSRRMGRSKTGLFLPRVVAAARPVFDELIAVQRHGGEPVRGLRTIFEEPHEDEAPIFGVARALAEGDGFMLAIDYPLITSDVLRYLAEKTGIPIWRGEPQVLCALYRAALLTSIEQRLAARRYDLRGLIRDAEVEIIPESELRSRFPGEPLMNVNNPEELEEAERYT